mmetsp:Transcript_36349/g.44420  ORF Transcript_36349/g.44420 Transcript_36349/m.44420 type:complete len:266 (-) Transcript_36349:179-976(-)|eukprot:CAMPEP_0172493342 /NCGR_PEP_ID=MMETSP1066-20121228/24742_1 /TAXON_ID=671091 /ORGANISM="Coscinodiscus wailesii, Strain CCMP2513" /LENGTH=265 /DNA_ID=CAMNT_0013263455 /DNA_START=54 /DNA_END=851 /DNA_ORIENTATION=+
MITRTIVLIISAHLVPSVFSFSPLLPRNSALITIKTSAPVPSSTWTLAAAKGGKGFGKKTDNPTKKKQTDPSASTSGTTDDLSQSSGFSSLESLEGSEFDFTASKVSKPVDIDPNAAPEDRTKEILRQRYGLRTYEEQQGDIKKAERDLEQEERMRKLKKMAEAENFDVFQLIPAPVLKAIDAFLKLGLTVCIVLFVLAGIGITVEAWSVATGGKIPENVDQFIVNVIEPNFTKGGLVLLGFSVSLGVFAAAQLGSETSQYQEKP